MSATPEAVARMYPSMTLKESAALPPSSSQSDRSPSVAVTGPPVGDVVFEQSHPHDMAARRYPNMKQPDPVAQKIADEIKGDEKPADALVEAVPENIAKLREANPLRYAAHYDVALGIRTKDVIDGKLPAEQVVVRNAVAGMANDMGLDAGALSTLMNQARAVKAGKALSTETISDTDKTDAYALMSRDPRVSKLMENFGITNDSRSLRILAAAARSERARQRLK